MLNQSKRDESQPNKAIYKIKRFPVHTADTTETMSQRTREHSGTPVQNVANILAGALGIGPAGEEECGTNNRATD